MAIQQTSTPDIAPLIGTHPFLYQALLASVQIGNKKFKLIVIITES